MSDHSVTDRLLNTDGSNLTTEKWAA